MFRVVRRVLLRRGIRRPEVARMVRVCGRRRERVVRFLLGWFQPLEEVRRKAFAWPVLPFQTDGPAL